MHEFHVSISNTEWYLLFSQSEIVLALAEASFACHQLDIPRSVTSWLPQLLVRCSGFFYFGPHLLFSMFSLLCLRLFLVSLFAVLKRKWLGTTHLHKIYVIVSLDEGWFCQDVCVTV